MSDFMKSALRNYGVYLLLCIWQTSCCTVQLWCIRIVVYMPDFMLYCVVMVYTYCCVYARLHAVLCSYGVYLLLCICPTSCCIAQLWCIRIVVYMPDFMLPCVVMVYTYCCVYVRLHAALRNYGVYLLLCIWQTSCCTVQLWCIRIVVYMPDFMLYYVVMVYTYCCVYARLHAVLRSYGVYLLLCICQTSCCTAQLWCILIVVYMPDFMLYCVVMVYTYCCVYGRLHAALRSYGVYVLLCICQTSCCTAQLWCILIVVYMPEFMLYCVVMVYTYCCVYARLHAALRSYGVYVLLCICQTSCCPAQLWCILIVVYMSDFMLQCVVMVYTYCCVYVRLHAALRNYGVYLNCCVYGRLHAVLCSYGVYVLLCICQTSCCTTQLWCILIVVYMPDFMLYYVVMVYTYCCVYARLHAVLRSYGVYLLLCICQTSCCTAQLWCILIVVYMPDFMLHCVVMVYTYCCVYARLHAVLRSYGVYLLLCICQTSCCTTQLWCILIVVYMPDFMLYCVVMVYTYCCVYARLHAVLRSYGVYLLLCIWQTSCCTPQLWCILIVVYMPDFMLYCVVMVYTYCCVYGRLHAGLCSYGVYLLLCICQTSCCTAQLWCIRIVVYMPDFMLHCVVMVYTYCCVYGRLHAALRSYGVYLLLCICQTSCWTAQLWCIRIVVYMADFMLPCVVMVYTYCCVIRFSSLKIISL